MVTERLLKGDQKPEHNKTKTQVFPYQFSYFVCKKKRMRHRRSKVKNVCVEKTTERCVMRVIRSNNTRGENT